MSAKIASAEHRLSVNGGPMLLAPGETYVIRVR